MKKLWIGIAAMALITGLGTVGVYATSANDGINDIDKENSQSAFEKMLPHAEQMHPELSTEQIKEMYNSCHGSNGPSGEGMMNRTQMNSNKIKF